VTGRQLADLVPLVAALGGVDILVLGDVLLDGWLAGDSVRLSREAPVQVVAVNSATQVPGGAGHAAVSAAALGARVRLLAPVGDDADGDLLRAALAARGVSCADLLTVPGRATVTKRRVLAGGQHLLRLDTGDTAPLPAGAERRLLATAGEAVAAADVVVVSDYGLGALGPGMVGLLARRPPRLLVVDARDPARWSPAAPLVVKPNATEAASLLGGLRGQDRYAEIVAGAELLFARTGARALAVTLDADGGVLLRRDAQPYRLAPRLRAPDTQAAGAGDTFTATLALALAAGAPLAAAAELAATAASVSVATPGTTACSADELRAALLVDGGPVLDLARLGACVRAHRARGRRLVLTNGCFDGLHRGHVAFLERARALGDVLVVGLNSDTSVRGLLGAGRPTHPLEDRAAVLAGLSCVDHVVAFDEPTADQLLDVVRPDVYAKGGDYTAAMLPEAPRVASYGGELAILPYEEDRRWLVPPAVAPASP